MVHLSNLCTYLCHWCILSSISSLSWTDSWCFGLVWPSTLASACLSYAHISHPRDSQSEKDQGILMGPPLCRCCAAEGIVDKFLPCEMLHFCTETVCLNEPAQMVDHLVQSVIAVLLWIQNVVHACSSHLSLPISLLNLHTKSVIFINTCICHPLIHSSPYSFVTFSTLETEYALICYSGTNGINSVAIYHWQQNYSLLIQK